MTVGPVCVPAPPGVFSLTGNTYRLEKYAYTIRALRSRRLTYFVAQIIKFLQVFVSYWTRHTVLGSPGVGRFLLRPTEAGREKLEGLPVLPDCRDARLASSS